MVLCLLSRDSHGDTGKLNHEETVRGPEIAISPEKSEILLLILVKILKKSDSTHSSSGFPRAVYLLVSQSPKNHLTQSDPKPKTQPIESREPSPSPSNLEYIYVSSFTGFGPRDIRLLF